MRVTLLTDHSNGIQDLKNDASLKKRRVTR